MSLCFMAYTTGRRYWRAGFIKIELRWFSTVLAYSQLICNFLIGLWAQIFQYLAFFSVSCEGSARMLFKVPANRLSWRLLYYRCNSARFPLPNKWHQPVLSTVLCLGTKPYAPLAIISKINASSRMVSAIIFYTGNFSLQHPVVSTPSISAFQYRNTICGL